MMKLKTMSTFSRMMRFELGFGIISRLGERERLIPIRIGFCCGVSGVAVELRTKVLGGD